MCHGIFIIFFLFSELSKNSLSLTLDTGHQPIHRWLDKLEQENVQSDSHHTGIVLQQTFFLTPLNRSMVTESKEPFVHLVYCKKHQQPSPYLTISDKLDMDGIKTDVTPKLKSFFHVNHKLTCWKNPQLHTKLQSSLRRRMLTMAPQDHVGIVEIKLQDFFFEELYTIQHKMF